MSRSPLNWQEVIADGNKTDAQLAHFVLSDLIGYRSTSLHRADDEDALTNLFSALRQLWSEPK